MQTRWEFTKYTGPVVAGLVLISLFLGCTQRGNEDEKPNILFVLSDDQSWLHTGVMGNSSVRTLVRTPVFDRISREGVLFTHVFSPAPCCGPTRAAILTGQQIWRLDEAANQFGSLAARFKVYPDILEEQGYHVGYIGKGWSPGDVASCGRTRNPAGKQYGHILSNPIPQFEAFLSACPADTPFCLWFGSLDPHRDYCFPLPPLPGRNMDSLLVPPIWPDVPEVRMDIRAYLQEICRFDFHLGAIMDILEQRGKLDNTLIIVTSDNGMPFPRAKANLYDLGVRVPMAVAWKGHIPPGRVVNDFVSLTDLAPTMLDAAGEKVPSSMTGSSLMDILTSNKSGRVEKDRDMIVTARERHAYSRAKGLGYPSRAIRTHDYLYIHNYKPDRWPAGDPPFYGDVDSWELAYYAPTKEYITEHKNAPAVRPFFDLCFGKRPAEELYDVQNDPHQMNNLLTRPRDFRTESERDYDRAKNELACRLDKYLKMTEDPRALGQEAIWDTLSVRVRTKPKPRANAPVQ